uniref:RAD51_interact domain-containing protein n=1 Tax=Mesocestoides corti TaxID=53468 RepID=A0A5K3FBM6_MESCO
MGISVSAKCPQRSSIEPEFNKICFDDSSERETVISTAKKKEHKPPVPRLHLPSKSASSASSVSSDETSDLPENEDVTVFKKTNIGEVEVDKGSVVGSDDNNKTCMGRVEKPSEEQTSLSWKCDILGGESDPDEVGWASHLSGDNQPRDLPSLGVCDPREKKAVKGLRGCSPSPLTGIRPGNETTKSFFIEAVAPKQKKTSQNRNFILRNKKCVLAKALKNNTSYSQLMTNKLRSAGESSMTGSPSHLESQPSLRTQQDPSPLV